MPSYNDYQTILLSYNFIGGAGRSQVPNSSSDARVEVDQDVNGFYQFYYFILASLSEMDSLGYYDTANNDIDNDNYYDREYYYLPTGNDPAVTNAYQLAILSSVLNPSNYGVSFEDVAKINFNYGTTSTAHIVIASSQISHLLS